MKKLTHAQIADLVIEAQQGNQEAFAALYTATVDRQLYFATAFLRDPIAAEDVVQDIYLSMFNALPKLKNPKTFVAYLNRTCYNACVDHKRKLYPQKYELDEDSLSRITDSSPDSIPENYLEIKETNKELQDALAQLPDNYKAAFLLRYYYEMKIKEIADYMQISESTVKRYVKSAAKQLKQQLHSQ